MKKIRLIVATAILAIAGNSVFSQGVTASANAEGNIVNPIQISTVLDMNFGNIAVGISGGTVILSPLGVRSTSGDVILPSITGTVQGAKFLVTGETGYTYSITLPLISMDIYNPSLDVMTIDSWTSSPSGTGTLTGGSEFLYIGGQLNVNPSQAPGVYSSVAPFDITVDYN